MPDPFIEAVADRLAALVIEASHARLCEVGRWVTSEKRIVDAAGLGTVEVQLIERLAAGEPPDRLAGWAAGELNLVTP